MFNHVGIRVADLAAASRFYDAALRPLGHARDFETTGVAGYGSGGAISSWLHAAARSGGGAHIAFDAPDRQTVDAFHAAGLAAGGTDNGGPGLRPDYGPEYYGAFLIDIDGNNVEAVCIGGA